MYCLYLFKLIYYQLKYMSYLTINNFIGKISKISKLLIFIIFKFNINT